MNVQCNVCLADILNTIVDVVQARGVGHCGAIQAEHAAKVSENAVTLSDVNVGEQHSKQDEFGFKYTVNSFAGIGYLNNARTTGRLVVLRSSGHAGI